MLWVILVIIAGLLAGWLIITYGYRHSILVVLGILVALVAVLVWYVRFGSQAQTGLVAPREVQLQNLNLTREYRTSYRMTGRLVNTSRDFTVTLVTIMITASDCKDEGENCIVVGDDKRSISVQIPPGQARDVVEQYIFPRFVLQGQLKWSYIISKVEAQRQ